MEREVHTMDADGKILGRLATKIATLLRGKHKPSFAPHIDCGDVVEVYNVEKVQLSGNKEETKEYWRHSGYPGGIRSRNVAEVRERDPAFILRHAVRGMLPDNKLRSGMLKRLKLHVGPQGQAEETPEPVAANGE